MAVFGAAAFVCAESARAQGNDAFAWGFAAGGIVPAGALADTHDAGFTGTFTLAFGHVGAFLGVRLDATYGRFGEKSAEVTAPETRPGDLTMIAATINLVAPVIGSADRFYLIGGVGAYGMRPKNNALDSKNDYGLNAGIGLWLPGISGFIETRYHHFFKGLEGNEPARFVPITLGILF